MSSPRTRGFNQLNVNNRPVGDEVNLKLEVGASGATRINVTAEAPCERARRGFRPRSTRKHQELPITAPLVQFRNIDAGSNPDSSFPINQEYRAFSTTTPSTALTTTRPSSPKNAATPINTLWVRVDQSFRSTRRTSPEFSWAASGIVKSVTKSEK
jgi:hypothetical protein